MGFARAQPILLPPTLRSCLFHPDWSEPEHVEHHGVALLFEFRRIDELGFCRAAWSRRNGDVLLAVDLEGHRWCRKAGADVDLPDLLERGVVVGRDRAIQQRQEDEPTTGCKRAAVVGIAQADGF